MRTLRALTPLLCITSLCACNLGPCVEPDVASESPAATPSASSALPPARAAASASPAEAQPPPPAGPCPDGMALIDGRFCIDRWEAALVDEHGALYAHHQPVKGNKLTAVSRPGVVPQAYISLFEATQACERAGKRMCTTQQWIDACMGSARPKRMYPYGNQRIQGVCNDQSAVHPVSRLRPGRQRHDFASLNDPRINQLEGTVAKTGSHEKCVTPEGVFDMVGNLLEWTRGQTRPLLMGGHYVDSAVNGDGCLYVTPDHKEHYRDFTTGFRCCARPDVSRAPAGGTETAGSPESPGTAPADAGRPKVGRQYPRSFDNAFGYLPQVSPPRYEPEEAACPRDMVLVEGIRCGMVEQTCKFFIDPPGMPERACGAFEKPTPCLGATSKMRFCIDRYELTAPGERLPLVNVSWSEAQLVCNRMDKRICFEREWEFACEGPEAWPYPYGFVRNGKGCNHDREDLFLRGNALHDQRVPADALPACKSPFGVFNLVGNVDEWTHREGSEAPHRSILRGGWWLMGRNRCRAATGSHGEAYAGQQTGVRCCKAAR